MRDAHDGEYIMPWPAGQQFVRATCGGDDIDGVDVGGRLVADKHGALFQAEWCLEGRCPRLGWQDQGAKLNNG